MEYRIEIIDTQNELDPLILHISDREINLSYEGSDDRTQPLVGSKLNFSLSYRGCDDAVYSEYFTDDEQRFKVYLKHDDTIDWIGFLLPNSYSEPYKSGLKFFQFFASDAIGLLKGKKLEDKYYEDEVTIIDLYSEILEKTGLGFDIYLSPAILNKEEEFYHKIYTDTKGIDDNDDAHKILEQLVHDMRCQLYQDGGKWVIEGINKRNIVTNEYYKYDSLGNYLGKENITKNIKELTFLSTPSIRLEPSFKEIIVSQKNEEFSEIKDISDNDSIDFLKYPHTFTEHFSSSYWVSSSPPLYPRVDIEDNKLYVMHQFQNQETELKEYLNLSLRNKPFVLKGWKIKFKLDIDLIGDGTYNESQVLNYAPYRIKVGDDLYRFNYLSGENSLSELKFNQNGNAKKEFYFTVRNSGYLDIELFSPYKSYNDTLAEGYKLNDLEVTLQNEDESEDIQYIKNSENTNSDKKEIELEFSDTVTGNNRGLYLTRKRDIMQSTAPYSGDIYKIYDLDGNTYFQLDLMTASVLHKFKKIPFYFFENTTPLSYRKVEEFEIIFNFKGGDEHVVKMPLMTIPPMIDPKVLIQSAPYALPSVESKENSIKWGDAVYKQYESNRYGQAVLNIENKLYKEPYISIEGDVKTPIKFSDIIRFRYKNEWKYLNVGNCEYNLSTGIGSVLLNEAKYDGSSVGQIAPYVYAGGVIKLGENNESASPSNAVAYAVNGNIETYLWEKVEGLGGNIINSSGLNPTFSNLTDNYYKFKLTVTDSNGVQSFDYVEVWRVQEITLEFDRTFYEEGSSHRRAEYKLKDTNMLPERMINLRFRLYNPLTIYSGEASTVTSKFIIQKNGISTNFEYIKKIGGATSTVNEQLEEIIISYKRGDDLRINVFASHIATFKFKELKAEYKFSLVSFSDEVGYTDVNNNADIDITWYLIYT